MTLIDLTVTFELSPQFGVYSTVLGSIVHSQSKLKVQRSLHCVLPKEDEGGLVGLV